jgi:hypothetical protein
MDEKPAVKRVELKICERCGGLWLRPGGRRWIYCGPCMSKVSELPPVRTRAATPRLNPKCVPAIAQERVQ